MRSPPSATPALDQPAAAWTPSLFGALRGIWLFTWKNQCTWRRLPIALAGLLALPLVVYLTILTPQAWAQKHRSQLGNPAVDLSFISRRLNRADVPLTPPQKSELLRILRDEYRQTEENMDRSNSSDPRAAGKAQEIEDCRQRIRQRAQLILSERQFAEFQKVPAPKQFDPSTAAPFSDLSWNRTAPFYHWLIDVYFFILLPLNCVKICGALIREELDADTLGFLTTRPLSRARLLTVKYLSQSAWLQIWMLAQASLLFAAAGFRQVPNLAALLPLFLAAQFLAVMAWGALGLFIGQISKNYMGLALVYGAVVEMGIGSIPTNINTLSVMRHLKTMLSRNPEIQAAYNWPADNLPASAGTILIATVFFASLAAFLFTFKEYHRAADMQK